MLELSNNRVECLVKEIDIGRKYWLFSIKEKEAGANEIYQSLIMTVEMNGISP